MFGGPRLRAEIVPRKLTVGVTDVGDVVFEPDPAGEGR